MNALLSAASVLNVYSPDCSLIDKLNGDATGLREMLASTIANNHPSNPGDVSPEAYLACRKFLSNFEQIFTLNYDLLLYWVVMQPKSLPSVSSDDGFRKSDIGLTWEDTDSQNLFFLHGALHIFYARAEFRKLTWKPGIPLIERIQGKLKEGWFPLLVAEGTSNQKLTKIRYNTYLSRGYRSFATLDGALFLYELSLAESDEHVLTLISGEQSNLTHLFISIFGDPQSDENKRIRDRVKGVADDRSTHSKEKLRIYFFDAITARVWGDQKTKKEERGPKTSHALNL